MSLIYSQLNALCNNPRFNATLIHLMPCSFLLFSNQIFNTDKVSEHSERLKTTLMGYRLKLDDVHYDCSGDSIFLGIISQLKEMSRSSSMLQEHLCSVGVLLANDDMKIVQALRNIVVNELVSNTGRYKYALMTPDKHFEEEANKFRECGYYSSKHNHTHCTIYHKIPAIIPTPPPPEYKRPVHKPTQNPLQSCISSGLITEILRYFIKSKIML